jgi:hypothetical protein
MGLSPRHQNEESVMKSKAKIICGWMPSDKHELYINYITPEGYNLTSSLSTTIGHDGDILGNSLWYSVEDNIMGNEWLKQMGEGKHVDSRDCEHCAVRYICLTEVRQVQ